MAKEYNVGDRLYLPVWVTEKETNLMMGPDKSTTITDAKFSYAYWHGKTGEGKVRYGEEGLLLTAEEVADKIDLIARSTLDEYSEKAQRKIEALTKQLEEANETIRAFSESEDIVRTNFDAKVDENKELKSRNAELEALLKEVMATRDEAIRQNDELIAENSKLKTDCNEWKDTANERLNAVQTLSAERNKVMAGIDELKNTLVDRTNDVQRLTEENDKLTAERDQCKNDLLAMKKDRDNLLADSKRTTEWYMEANRTATEAAEANDDLKAKIADLRNRVGEQLAQIQDLNAEVHFHKEFGEGLDKQQKELQARYDELDSVNKEQAEKIRKLEVGRDTWERNAKAWKMTADGMSKRAEELQAENEKLNNRNKYLESEKNRKPIVHVLTNDGHVYAFTSSGKVSVKYHTELNILMIEDGEKTIAGFSRGDKPGNLSAWWMG